MLPLLFAFTPAVPARYTTGAPTTADSCTGGPCGGMAHYPVGPGIVYEATFDVPEPPKRLDGICFYIYFNIFFSGKGRGTMNQVGCMRAHAYGLCVRGPWPLISCI